MKNNSPSGKTDKYSNDIMELTRDDQPEPVRTIAEAMGLMMVKVEAREYRLELMVKELEELNGKIRQSAINTVSAWPTLLTP